MSGTSMATPLAAGIVALVKAQYPSLEGRQLIELVKSTSDNVDHLNSGYEGMLGGRINAYNAVSKNIVSVHTDGFTIEDADGDGILRRDETFALVVNIKNFLSPVNSVDISISSDNPSALLQSSASFGPMETGEVTEARFEARVAGNAERNSKQRYLIDITSDDYSGTDTLDVLVLPNFVNIEANDILTTATNLGRIGKADFLAEDGNGWQFLETGDILFECAVLAGISADRISSASRSDADEETMHYDSDFVGIDIAVHSPGKYTDHETETVFFDRNADQPLNIGVQQHTYASSGESLRSFVIFDYLIYNYGSETLDPFYFGLLMDWDIDGYGESTIAENVAGCDEESKMCFVADMQNNPELHGGAVMLSDNGFNCRSINNSDEGDPYWGIWDGFSEEERWSALSSQTKVPDAGPGDVSQVVSGGPYTLDAGDSVSFTIAIISGESRDELESAAQSASSQWVSILEKKVEEKNKIEAGNNIAAAEKSFVKILPGPNGISIKGFLQNPQPAGLRIFNAQGRMVFESPRNGQAKSRFGFEWRAPSGGAWIYKLEAGEMSKTGKVIIH
jgi:hypothetical protein